MLEPILERLEGYNLVSHKEAQNKLREFKSTKLSLHFIIIDCVNYYYLEV